MSNRSTPGCSSGFSLVELLLALGILSVAMGVVMSIMLSSRDILETDQARTAVNQNVRSGMDLLGIDIRQAGERLPGDIPALELINGASGAPDTLIVRRNQLDVVLPVCKEINAGSNADAVFVGKKGKKPPPGCAPVPDNNGDGWPDNIEAWRDYRLANGGVILAYIYNPTRSEGEFFVYDDEDNSTFHLHKANDEKWQLDYLVDEQPRIYILEQRMFRVRDGRLQAIINGDTDNALNLVSDIDNLQGRGFFVDGSVVDAIGATDPWEDLESVEITLVGRRDFDNRTMRRQVTSRFFPRNVLTVTE